MASLAVTQRTSAIRCSLEALQDEGFIQGWHEYRGDPKRTLWTVTSMYTAEKYSTRDVEIFIRGAKAVLFVSDLPGA